MRRVDGVDWYVGRHPHSEGAWGGTPAADGSYYAFVQGGGVLSQLVTVGAGKYLFSWSDAGRGNNGVAQTYIATIGGRTLGTYTTQPGSAFAVHSVTLQLTSGGSKALSFSGQVPADVTSFIDNVSVTSVPEPGIWAMMIAGFGLVGGALRRRKVEALRFA